MAETVAKVYAGSLYEVAQEISCEQTVLEQLLELDKIFSHESQLMKVLQVPVISKEEKIQIVSDLFSDHLEIYVLNFLKVLVQQERINQFHEMVLCYREQYDTEHGIGRVKVHIAKEINEEQKQRLKQKIESMIGKEAVIEYQPDESLIGGMMIDIGDRRIDVSVKSRIDRMKEAISKMIS